MGTPSAVSTPLWPASTTTSRKLLSTWSETSAKLSPRQRRLPNKCGLLILSGGSPAAITHAVSAPIHRRNNKLLSIRNNINTKTKKQNKIYCYQGHWNRKVVNRSRDFYGFYEKNIH